MLSELVEASVKKLNTVLNRFFFNILSTWRDTSYDPIGTRLKNNLVFFLLEPRLPVLSKDFYPRFTSPGAELFDISHQESKASTRARASPTKTS
jgi:hypothetical protein